VLSIVPIGALPTLLEVAGASATTQQLPRVALVKLWSITHTAYMAKFIGEDYVAVFEGHGDASLDGKYIGVLGSGKSVYIYKVSTGELIAKLTSDTDDGWGDTWEITSWEPFQAVKKWDRFGFFSADSKRMIEDARRGGTNARVVDTTSWSTIPIDWGFTDTDGSHFYAVQLDYSGSTLAVGYIGETNVNDTSKLLVYKYDPAQGKYVKAFEHVEYGDYGRRLQMTLDGEVIIVGGRFYGYLDVFRYDEDAGTYVRAVHYRLPDAEGIGSLGISDPYNVGYIVAGTINGWVIIARYDPSTDEFKVIYQKKEAPDNSWLYNPFYERWIPKVTEVFALCSHRDSDRPGYGIVYDVLTNQTVVIHFADPGTPQWSAAAVSPEANYVFIGNSLYMVVKRDVQSGHPRVRFWGSMIFERGMQDLGSTIEFKAPARDWHLYFYSGRVTISKIYTEVIPVTLTDDEDILYGRLGVMYSRGLISSMKLVESSGKVERLEVAPMEVPEKGFTAEHTVSMSGLYSLQALYGWNGHGFGGATVSSVMVIDVPFTAPMDAYSELNLTYSMVITVAGPVFDIWKELQGIFIGEIPIGGATYAAGKALASKSAQVALMNAVKWGIAKTTTKFTPETLNMVEQALAATAKAARTAGRILGYVGVALFIDAGVGAYYHYVNYGSLRFFVMTLPVVEDPYGNRYAAVVLLLPREEIKNYYNEYRDHLDALAEKLGFKDIGIVVYEYGDTWKEYKMLLESGRIVTVDLKSAIEATIAAKHGYSLSQLKVTGAKIVIEVLAHGSANLWDWLQGGAKVPFVLTVSGSSILPKALTAGGKIYDDPAVIADLLKKVTINGKDYELVAGSTGAYADFQIQLGADKLVIDFGRRLGYFADIRIEADVLVKKDMQPLDDFGYVASLHYDWEDTLIRLDRIGFVDMPYPMYMAERTFVFRYGNFTHEITDAFELSQVVESTLSPSGKFYYYITRENTIYIDPANGGIMQPCKTYIFRYFYKQPPDVALHLYLNGTQVTSTKARHATVVLNSSKAQDVEYTVTFKVKTLKGLREVTLYEESLADTLHCEANISAYRSYLIEKYVDLAVQTMAINGTPAFVEITAKITKAKYNYIKENDEKTVIYYPPSGLVERYGQNATLTVYTYDAINGSAIPNATITVSNIAASYTAKTNETGYAVFNVTIGLWNINATAEGYHSYATDLYVYGNMTFKIPLMPINATPVVEPPLNTSENPIIYNEAVYWWLSTQVIWSDGAPFENAIVTIRNATDNSIIFQGNTDGTGYVHYLMPNGSWVKVEVNATNPLNASQTFYGYRELNVTQHYWIVFRLPWTSELYEPEVMLTSLSVTIHRGQGYYFGNVSHLILIGLWTNYPQTITLRLELVDAETNETINAKDVTVTLDEGHTLLMEWIAVNASKGMYVRAHANITSFEADTDLDNNELWSGTVFLKPMVDIQVFVIWRPVEQKQRLTILPEDVIEVDIGIVLPINTSRKPAVLTWRIEKLDLEERRLKAFEGRYEEIRATLPGTVWRNVTITVPWTSRLVITANVTHEWEDFGYNNYINLTIPIDPDVKLTVIEKPMFLSEGQAFTVKVNLTSNVEPGAAMGWVSLIDETTDTLIKRVQVSLEPRLAVEVEAKAPENPTAFWMFKVPSATHTLTALFAGYDLYTANNQETFDVTVISNQWLWIIAIIVAIIAIIVVVKAVAHTIEEAREERRKFIRRKTSTLTGTIEETREHFKFIRRKRKNE